MKLIRMYAKTDTERAESFRFRITALLEIVATKKK